MIVILSIKDNKMHATFSDEKAEDIWKNNCKTVMHFKDNPAYKAVLDVLFEEYSDSLPKSFWIKLGYQIYSVKPKESASIF